MKSIVRITALWNSMSMAQKRALHAVLLAIAGMAVYANSLQVPFILDDHYAIQFYGKQNLVDLILNGSQRRVVELSLALNYRIHGMQVAGYHITNIAIHILSAIMVYFVMISMLTALRTSFPANTIRDEISGSKSDFISLATALLFTVHPLQTQAVTYIIQRYTSLATFFYLSSLLLFIIGRLSLDRGGSRIKIRLFFAGAFMAGCLALGSKQIAATLPLMVLVMEIFLFRGRLVNRRFFIAIGAVTALVAGAVLLKWHNSSLADFLYDLHHATSEDPFTDRTTYFLTQTRVVLTYLGMLLVPVGQSLVHDFPIYKSIVTPQILISIAVHISLFATATVLFVRSARNLKKNDHSNGCPQRLASLGIFWFYIALLIESSFIPIIDVIFEHRVYLPSIGFFITITSLVTLAVQNRHRRIIAGWVALLAVSIILGGMTVARNRVWSDSFTLWQESAQRAPNKWLAQANLASEYFMRRMPEQALPLFVRAIELNPNLFIETQVHLGYTLKALNLEAFRFSTGEEFLVPGGPLGSKTLNFKLMSQWLSVKYNNMGLAYEYLNEPEKAANAFQVSLISNPAYAPALYNIGFLAARRGEVERANLAISKLQNLGSPLARTLANIMRNR